MSSKSGGRSDLVSSDLKLASNNFIELARLKEAEREAGEKIHHAETTSVEMIKEAEKNSEKVYEAEMERIMTELEEKYVLEEQKVHNEVKRIVAAGEVRAADTRKRADAKIDEAVGAVVKKLVGRS